MAVKRLKTSVLRIKKAPQTIRDWISANRQFGSRSVFPIMIQILKYEITININIIIPVKLSADMIDPGDYRGEIDVD